jgi:hypothetical protein
MPKNKVKKLSPTHYRIYCRCGENFHEVSKGNEEGEVVIEHFLMEPSDKENSDEPATIKPPKKSPSVGLF